MKDNMNKKTLISVLLIGLLNGCYGLGKQNSICEEMGCSYKKAGVCANPIDILKNKELANTKAYIDIDCSKCQNSLEHKYEQKSWYEFW
jgi:hypothetical protein